MIIKSLNKFCILFQFLELRKLSDDRLSELCEMYSKSNENTQHYFDYLKCNLNLINEMNNRKKNLEDMNDEQRNKMKDLETKITSLQSQFNDSEKVNAKLKGQLDDSNNLINEQQNKMKEIEEKMMSLQNQFKNSEKVISQLQNQLNDSQELNNEQQNKIKEIEELLQKQRDDILQSEKEKVEKKELVPFEGQIVASVEKEAFINAEINLIIKHGILDTTKSKVIVSTSDAKNLGSEAYENGEPITSLHMNTKFVCKKGLYYVRCIVFNTEGESNEIVSNSVTTNGSCLTFDYEGKPAKIQLPKGQYKLEVWGAKGGNSTGKGGCDERSKQSIVEGGLGGYSRGILNLKQNETIFIFVGEEGHPSNSSVGSNTKGSFPDGGGTTTYHCNSSYPTVPGTGGGSTSIRIGSDKDHARVIVAGGGGGSSGSCQFIDRGGFGGGLNGGNSSYHGNKQNNCGYGTQTGSTCGLGLSEGDQGSFGKGAEGGYKSECDSGGGGGGGWYGGGSGGYGTAQSGSGGGGSGWTFTESSFNKWKEGDSSNSSKYVLNSSYYLTDAVTLSGNEEIPKSDGNGTEHGHAGNGYAKITLL